MSSRRLSSIGSRPTPLRDARSNLNSQNSNSSSTRSSSAPRRTSLGGGALRTSDRKRSSEETPGKDRFAVLCEWRQSRTQAAVATTTTTEDAPKRLRMQENASSLSSGAPPPHPLLPPASAHSSTNYNHNSNPSSSATADMDKMTPLERFRLRKALKQAQQQQQQHQQQVDENGMPLSQEDADDTATFYSTNSGGLMMMPVASTPLHQACQSSSRSSRRCSSAFSLRGRNSISFLASSTHEADVSFQNQTLSQLSQDSVVGNMAEVSDAPVNTVEGADLRSRIRELQQRVNQLEKEKIDISMSKAPLEAMFRQKEDAWQKEQNRLLQMVDTMKQQGSEANNRYRDLEVQFQVVEEECKQLRNEVRKASSSRNQNSMIVSDTSSAWSRQLQNDRDVVELRERLRHSEDEIDSLRLDNVSLEKELHAVKIEFESLMRSYRTLREEYEEVANSTSSTREAEIKLEHLTTEHIATSAQLNAVCSDLAATKARAVASIEAKEQEHKEAIKKLEFEMSVLKKRVEKVAHGEKSVIATNVQDVAVLKARLDEKDRQISELEKRLFEGETLRRQMHNRIQELRGNIRVFVRTRPFLPNDGHSRESAIDVAPDGESLSITDTRNAAPHDFKFDKVFRPSDGQDYVFNEVSDFVQSALDGYHVCLFSYGQTGSGKTHTMQGSGKGVMRGIIPRAVEQILIQANVMQSQKWDFKLSASFLEIYNEELRDLLVTMSSDKKSEKDKPKLAIKRSREGKSYVENLTEISIKTIDSATGLQQLESLMAVAARARSVASTKMNAQSSRSHSVFMLQLRGYNSNTGAEVFGALNLCDLAGSERLDRSGADSDAQRLRETQAINKSLSCLGDVFNALAQGSSHVPYRNSKLTYLLQDCLSGDGKALMFVNLSPTVASSNESLCSLRFAQRVNQVELGKPTKHIQYTSDNKPSR